MQLSIMRRVLLGLCVLGLPAAAAGQVANLGSRAQGMAGAFVAVADDPSAVYWNPAGLAGAVVIGALFDVSRERARPEGAPLLAPAGAEALTRSGRLFAVALPPLGLSYYRLRYAGAQVGTADTGLDGRQVEGRDVSFRALETRQFGVTLVQSLADGVVVGTTVRFVRGGVTAAAARRPGRWQELTDEAEDLETGGESLVDLDAGVMVSAGAVRLGLVVHNLREPAFSSAAGAVTLARHARVGVAYGPGWPGQSRLIVAVDADLTRAATLGPDRRDVAAGLETWAFNRRLGVRGGIRASTLGDARPLGSAGVSLGLTPALFVEAHGARGRRDDRSWSLGARVSY
jgi:hypothetical protein